MNSMTRHFGLKKVVLGFLLVFDSHPCQDDVQFIENDTAFHCVFGA